MIGNDLMFRRIGRVFIYANFPAFVSTFLSLNVISLFSDKPFYAAPKFVGDAFFIAFCFAQWLFVAFIAKTIAARFRHQS
jgi:hypothetical protein